MFIEITEPKSVVGIYNMLRECIRGNEPLSVEAAERVLRMSNAPMAMKHLLTALEKQPDKDLGKFKDVLCNMFANREQRDNIKEMVLKIAARGGFAADIKAAMAAEFHEGVYYKAMDGAEKKKCIATAETNWREKELPVCDEMFFVAEEVNLENCNLAGAKSVKFAKGAEVKLWGAKNLPADLDFSECAYVDLSICDLVGQKNLKFAKGAKVDLNRTENLPAELDFSECIDVTLSWCDLSNQSNLKFANGSAVYLWGAKNLPADIDFSECKEVVLGMCDLSNQPNLKFPQRAKVYLDGAENLPADLDFSECAKVKLSDCDWTGVKTVRFAGRKQADEAGADVEQLERAGVQVMYGRKGDGFWTKLFYRGGR